MSVNTKAIKRRIKSVGSTHKITKAMQMISAVKMRKAVDSAINTRTYATLAWDLLVKLSKTKKKELPLLDARQVKKLLIIMITSNRGLCGSFNANIIKKTAEQLNNPINIGRQRVENTFLEPSSEMIVDVIGIGKKGADFAKKMNYNLIASFSDFSDTPTLNDVLPISRMVIEAYEKKQYDKVVAAYTDFKSTINQVAKFRQVLPISEFDLEKMLLSLGDQEQEKQNKKMTKERAEFELDNYLFEPNQDQVLQIILPKLVETQIYQAVLESSASEHSARMMAMQNASEAASEMIGELNLIYNKARQAGITQEIAEIAGGAAALE
ncbi:MAG TPA: ATP synthase F1 subunit gamma [Candidatus Magasanikbacteria bacterium]|jgi:F-type H+-transporting ATPase subunit gamma|nr:ATP synthase F1 subunit gamma [Candidatus Magasanikbacteria bacterium]NLZ97020.1 ATP synthase F1 subunit gamma [Candidatus Magasanikbacteria bacterium]HQF57280.1 ATP synthase F1 subunit gamma [Candidatus Magasanikbacteria bacterium]HQL52526.1 ATP synthase F1 subunit gamma [Candidatus Magasanikbacteria bacterium]